VAVARDRSCGQPRQTTAAGGQACRVSTTLSGIERVGGLSAGQVVTTLVGLALWLGELHAGGRWGGPLQPRQVEVSDSGRPQGRPSTTPEGWRDQDDVLALLRLGAALAAGDDILGEALRDRADSGPWELIAVASWLLTLATPEPLSGGH